MPMCVQVRFQFRADGGSPWRCIHRQASRSRFRRGAQLRPGMRYWNRRPNPAHLLIALVRQILKFHETEPLLMSDQPCTDHFTPVTSPL
jgi:hypothetical protein